MSSSSPSSSSSPPPSPSRPHSPPPPPPLIAIVGTTGAGKSDLAVHLAHRLGHGEVLNSDTLQVYRGLDIITNKMPLADRLGVPHHLLDIRSITESYSVKEFEADALDLIERLGVQNKPCVLVGGTHYYLQYLLWGDELAVAANDEAQAPVDPVPIPSDLKLSSLSPTQLHALLAKLDPVAAQQWHVNDTRRTRRSIERYYQRGCVPLPPVSDSDESRAHLRYPTLVIWVHTDQPVLDQRLDKRVDEMVDRGMFGELWRLRLALRMERLREGVEEEGQEEGEGKSRGVEQAIGVKEFDEYCALVEAVARDAEVDVTEALDLHHPVAGDEGDPDPVVRAIKLVQTDSIQPQLDQIAALRTSSLAAMKLATRKYARRQISWLRARLSPRIARHPDAAHMLVVDTTNVKSPEDFVASVVDKVFPIARAFVDAFTHQDQGQAQGGEWKVDPVSVHPRARELLRLEDQGGRAGDQEAGASKMECKVCERTFRTKQEWEAHQGSRAHRRVAKQRRKAAGKEAAYWASQKSEGTEERGVLSDGSDAEERGSDSDRPAKVARREQ